MSSYVIFLWCCCSQNILFIVLELVSLNGNCFSKWYLLGKRTLYHLSWPHVHASALFLSLVIVFCLCGNFMYESWTNSANQVNPCSDWSCIYCLFSSWIGLSKKKYYNHICYNVIILSIVQSFNLVMSSSNKINF